MKMLVLALGFGFAALALMVSLALSNDTLLREVSVSTAKGDCASAAKADGSTARLANRFRYDRQAVTPRTNRAVAPEGSLGGGCTVSFEGSGVKLE